MENKIELEVVDISDTQAQAGAYVMLLGEKQGTRKLPIIIGASEAQATAICLKGVKTQRPLTHDLFNTCLSVLGSKLLRILIYKVDEGVFYSYLYIKQGEEIIRIDARTSDAIALALRANAPILIYETILDKERARVFDHDEQTTEYTTDEITENSVNNQELEKALSQAIQEENYELAASLRDKINKNK